jgi:tetratricopeptide (TPR) repeat protein
LVSSEEEISMSRTRNARAFTALLLLTSLILPTAPVSATCGGGGGGGMGGAMSGHSSEEVYHVPWKVVGGTAPVPAGDLGVYWFPKSPAEVNTSRLRLSRTLTLVSERCVAEAIITSDNTAVRSKYGVAADASALLLVDAGGVELGRMEPQGGPFDDSIADKLVTDELDKREAAAKGLLNAAKERLAAKDEEEAAALYTKVWQQRCLIPDSGKKAAKALKKLGRPVEDASLGQGASPVLTGRKADEIVRVMVAGLEAEREGDIGQARTLYERASRIDPSDAVPLRYLGELMRHEIGDWDAARSLFEQVLAMPADVVSKAVALHGLGKMTIHEGQAEAGLSLFQQSLDAYPLALTYRNLAVYWNSEKDHVNAHAYVQQALALDPDDDYNRIFAATYFVELGRPDEAREVALKFSDCLPASYNLAAIHAQLGDRAKALALLQRHFTVYETFDAVRAKEMQEARDDVAFESLHDDPAFLAMTARADGGGPGSTMRRPRS